MPNDVSNKDSEVLIDANLLHAKIRLDKMGALGNKTPEEKSKALKELKGESD